MKIEVNMFLTLAIVSFSFKYYKSAHVLCTRFKRESIVLSQHDLFRCNKMLLANNALKAIVFVGKFCR